MLVALVPPSARVLSEHRTGFQELPERRSAAFRLYLTPEYHYGVAIGVRDGVSEFFHV